MSEGVEKANAGLNDFMNNGGVSSIESVELIDIDKKLKSDVEAFKVSDLKNIYQF